MKILFNEKVIEITKAEARKASVYNSEAYKEMMNVISIHPGFRIETKVTQRKPARRKVHYNGLTFKYMEVYIKNHDNAEERLKEYEEMKSRAKACSNYYAQVRDWFLGAYPEVKITNKEAA